MLAQVANLQPHEVFLKHHSITSKMNSIKTGELIQDIKVFSGSFVQSEVHLDEENICSELNKLLPEEISVDDLFNK